MKPTILKNFLVKISSIILIFLAVKQEEDLYIYILIMSMTMFISTSILLFQIKNISKNNPNIKNQILHIKGSIMLFLPQVAILLYLQIGKILIETITHDIKQVAFYDMGEK